MRDANFLSSSRFFSSQFFLWLLTGLVGLLGVSAEPAFSMSKGATTAASSPSSRHIWVQKPDGAVSCESEKGQALEAGQKELRKARVEVFASRKGNDGQMHIQMCGASQGTFNLFEIRESDLPKALALGFARAAKSD